MPEAAEDTPQAHSTLPPKPPAMHGRAMPSTVRCLHHIWKGSTCRLCLDVCPASAITVSSTVTIDRQACFDCGLCAVVCPTDGIIPSALAHENLYQRIKSRIKEHGVETLYLTCSQTEVEGASDWVYTTSSPSCGTPCGRSTTCGSTCPTASASTARHTPGPT